MFPRVTGRYFFTRPTAETPDVIPGAVATDCDGRYRDTIQDIHVRRNVVERWLGLGTVEVETAGSGAGAESLPGLRDFELVRDFLYERMRGGVARPSEDGALNGNESVKVLREIRDALREARAAIQQEPKR